MIVRGTQLHISHRLMLPLALLAFATPAWAEDAALSCQQNASGNQWTVQDDSGNSVQEVYTSEDECQAALADSDTRDQFVQELKNNAGGAIDPGGHGASPDSDGVPGDPGSGLPGPGGGVSPDGGMPTVGQPPQ